MVVLHAITCAPAFGATKWIRETNVAPTWPTDYLIPQPADTNDIIQINGLQYDGFDTAFDEAMRTHSSAGTTIYVSPGVFATRGVHDGGISQTNQLQAPGYRLQSGCRLHGSGNQGANATKLILTNYNSSWGAIVVGANQFNLFLGIDHLGNIQTTASNVWVTDLMVDCNARALGATNNAHPWNFQGVQLWGTGGMHIERVSVINAAGYVPNREDFILCINSPTDTLSKGNVIRECKVSQFVNDDGNGTCSAISLNRFDVSTGRIEGIVEDCEVYLNGDSTRVPGGEFAYNAHNSRSAIFRGNYAEGAQRGFNNDQRPNETITLAYNTFVMPPGNNHTAICWGMLLVAGTEWSRIYDNNITLSGRDSCAIVIRGATPEKPSSHDIFLHNNRVYKASDWTTGVLGYGFNFQPNDSEPSNVHLEYNTVASEFDNLVPGQVGAVLGNTGVYKYWSNSVLHALAQPKWWGYRYTPNRLDFDMNRSIDFILANSSGTMQAWLMSGTQLTLQGSITPASSSPWHVIGAGDLDRNGRSDLLLIYPITTALGYWSMDGRTLEFGSVMKDLEGNDCLAGSYVPVCIGDMNNDGSADLIMQHPGGYIGVWYMRGERRSGYAMLNPSSAGNWRAVGTGDFDQDGNVDILFQHNDANHHESELGVWFMNGNGTWSGAASYLVPLEPEDKCWRAVGSGDFDGNGHVDILFQYKVNPEDWGGRLCIWLMNDLIRQGDPIDLGFPDTGFSVVGPK